MVGMIKCNVDEAVREHLNMLLVEFFPGEAGVNTLIALPHALEIHLH